MKFLTKLALFLGVLISFFSWINSGKKAARFNRLGQKELIAHSNSSQPERASKQNKSAGVASSATLPVAKTQEVYQIPLSENAKLWQRDMPRPQTQGQKVFLDLLAAYHDSYEEPTSQETQAIALQFLHEGPEFSEYITKVLNHLDANVALREKGFIYEFVKRATPDYDYSGLLENDLALMASSQFTQRDSEREKMVEIYLSQPGVTFERKFDILDFYHLTVPNRN